MDKARKKDLQAILDNLTDEELETVRYMVAETQNRKREQRKKELWGNVVAAIEKYEREVEPIMVLIPDDIHTLSIHDLQHPGGIVTRYD